MTNNENLIYCKRTPSEDTIWDKQNVGSVQIVPLIAAFFCFVFWIADFVSKTDMSELKKSFYFLKFPLLMRRSVIIICL